MVGSGEKVGEPRKRTLAESTFPGDSEMAAKCRAFDWASTPLGPAENWSHALRTATSIVLTSRNPMFLFWGPRHIQLYNDSYKPSLGLGDRPIRALGGEGETFWTEIWDTIGPQINRVMTKGESTWYENQFLPIERNGAMEDVWWTYGYSPVFDDDGSVGGVLVVCMETTQRVRDEQERERLVASLISERGTLAAIFDLSPSFLAIMRSPNHVFQRVNRSYTALVGNRQLVGLPVQVALPEVSVQGFVSLLDAVRETGLPYIGKRVPAKLARTSDGELETRYLDLVYQRIIDADGDRVIIAHGMDVTEQVLASDVLRAVEAQLRDQFAKLPVPTVQWELRGDDFVLIGHNDAAEQTLPMLHEGAVGKTRAELFPVDEKLVELFHHCLRENVVCHHTITLPGPRGLRTFELTIGPQPPKRVLVHGVDMTERIELEEQLRQAQKMEAVGQLAGGIAHDFNNLLTVIEGHSSLLMEELGPEDDRYGDAEEINKAGIRAAGLTRQLLAFSNKQILKPVTLGLNDLIRETEKMLSRLLGENIGIVLDLRAEPDGVSGDASQFSQVLMNLALNSRDAMGGHGTLTIATTNSETAGEASSATTVYPGGYVLLEISDQGAGMDEETLSRIFEPFYTTKPTGMGTGLGLATVYNIVSKANGYVSAKSSIGQGTKFCIYLPCVPIEKELLSEKAETIRSTGDETILLVEDESAVRNVVQRLLEKEGYTVMLAEDGIAAVRMANAFAGRIDLVISDTVMPGMGGPETVAKLREQRPALKSLFMSGHTDDQLLRHGIRSAKVRFIQKPFTAEIFSEAVRSALADSSGM